MEENKDIKMDANSTDFVPNEGLESEIETQGPKKISKDDPDYIPVKEKVAYGVGALMDGGGVALMGCVMLYYMTRFLGISAAAAGAIVMASKAWDAVTDPAMGVISDNTRSRLGRRRPYMFVGGFLLILGMALLFLPASQGIASLGGRIAYVLIMYLLWNTFSTITQVPYCSLASDISGDYSERDKANTVKLIFTSASAGLSYLGPTLALEAFDKGTINATHFWLIMMVYGVLFGGGLIIASIFVKERVGILNPDAKAKFSFRVYGDALKNKSFRWHIVMYSAAFMCMDILSALAVYYALDVWGGATLFGKPFTSMYVIAPLMGGAVAMFPVCRYVMDKKSKQFAFRMGLPAYILGGIMLGAMSPDWAPTALVPVFALIMGLGFGGAQMMPWIIFPDTVDVAELKLGHRPTGVFSGMMTLARKLAGALGVFVAASGIQAFGYKETPIDATERIVQTGNALLGVRIVLGSAVVILISIALFASFKYKVNSQKLDRIKYFNQLRRDGVLDEELTEEEQAEKAHLIKELA